VLLRLKQTVACGQPQRAGFNACRQITAKALSMAVGLAVLQWSGVFFTQAQGFAEPQAVEAIGAGVFAWAHAVFRL
jgi:hypothetical protein